MQVIASDEYKKYLSTIEKHISSLTDIAKKARTKGIDPAFEPESTFAKDLGEMVEGLVGPPGISERIRALTKEKTERHEMAFIIATEIIYAKFGHINRQEAAEQAVKTSLAVMTGGITAAPIQGISSVTIKNNLDKTQYLAIYFAGPIRSAAGTEQALTLVLGDFIRKRLGLDRYKPTDAEINRFIEEVRLYEREVGKFQYHITDEELEYSLRNLPVEVTGTETNPIEVSCYRNLFRIETNRIRAGALRIVNDGVIGRSQKILRIVENLGIEGWSWLKRIKESKQAADTGKKLMYMEDVIAGRPIFAFPSLAGGFRLRYGRSRNTGLAALGIHPATMRILNNFLASGTQIRIESPGKGGIVVPVDTIEPPIVKLKCGSVVKVNTVDEADKINKNIEKILFLGDLLIAFGEFLENNKPLAPSGYVEEWWVQDFKRALQKDFLSMDSAAKILGLSCSRLNQLIEAPLFIKPTVQEALTFVKILKLPLHPTFTYFWKEITFEELVQLRLALMNGKKKVENNILNIELSLNPEVQDILDRLGIPHKVLKNKILIENEALILCSCLKIDASKTSIQKQRTIIETIKTLSGISIQEKAPTYIGSRMGRPEKARKRDMSPPVHTLFPVGLDGGPRRNIINALKKGEIFIEISTRNCPDCGIVTHKLICPSCNSHTVIKKSCPRCGRSINSSICPVCMLPTVGYQKRSINIKQIYKDAVNILGPTFVDLVKGVRGLTNVDKTPESIEKGILRAKYDLSVYKDGTIRFDATNAPLTHFNANEIDVPIETLRDLGYNHDMFGKDLKNSDQICELKIQDVIIPRNCADYFINLSKFLDELLEKVYKLPRYYNIKERHNLIGHIIIGFAPHTSAGIIGRIIGFTEANVCYAHPLWHNIKRRDCDGDEDALMLALDVLLNFSKSYLPSRIGGMMDTPLLLISTIDPFEVDEVHNMDASFSYPLAFYQKSLQGIDPKVICKIIDIIEHRLGKPAQFEGYGFTHHTFNINEGNLNSSYMKLGAMANKLHAQLQLADKIKAVNADEVAKKVLNTHLLRDIAGNLRAFTKQKVRCKLCNTKYRRIPLSGKCYNCGGDLLFTVYRKGIEKYLEVAEELIQNHRLGEFYQQRLSLIRDEIASLFKDSVPEKNLKDQQQMNLSDFLSTKF